MIEPVVCVPKAIGTIAAATAAADPEDEPPGRVLRVMRISRLAGREGCELGGHGLAEAPAPRPNAQARSPRRPPPAGAVHRSPNRTRSAGRRYRTRLSRRSAVRATRREWRRGRVPSQRRAPRRDRCASMPALRARAHRCAPGRRARGTRRSVRGAPGARATLLRLNVRGSYLVSAVPTRSETRYGRETLSGDRIGAGAR